MGNLSLPGMRSLPALLRLAARPVMHHRLVQRLRKLLSRTTLLKLMLTVMLRCRLRKDLLRHPPVLDFVRNQNVARDLSGDVAIHKVI